MMINGLFPFPKLWILCNKDQEIGKPITNYSASSSFDAQLSISVWTGI